MKAILVKTLLGVGMDKDTIMVAKSEGVASLVRRIVDLPKEQPAMALAKLLCHKNGWSTDLCYGFLPNGDEVFCFRNGGRMG